MRSVFSSSRLFVMAAFGLIAASPLHAAEATFDRTLNVNGNVNLVVSTGSGYVHISPGSDSQVHIFGRVKSGIGGWLSGGGSAEDRVKQVAANPPIEQSGNTVRIGKKNGDWQKNVSIDYEITAPKGAVVEAGSGSGDLRIQDMRGGLKAETGSGSIEAHGVGGAVMLGTGSGEIRAELLEVNGVKAETGSGNIHLAGIKGSLKAETGSGDIEAKGQPTEDWKLETGSGSVSVDTQGARFTLDADTGSGSVHSEPAVSTHGTVEKHHLMGEVNGGGPLVRIETGSGDIRIR